MTSPEYAKYERLTKDIEADFLILAETFPNLSNDFINLLIYLK